MKQSQYNKVRAGVKVFEGLKKILPNTECIKQVIKYIYDLEKVTDIVYMPYEKYQREKSRIEESIDRYESMLSYKDSCRHCGKQYFEYNGEIVKDEFLDMMIHSENSLSCDREQFIVFVLSHSITIEDKTYLKGSLIIVKHPSVSLTVYETNIAKLLGYI